MCTTDMIEWARLIEDTLGELDGRSVCVPGAKLHTEVSKAALRKTEDFSQYLRDEGKSFADFLAGIPGISLHKRRGTDMLVGFDGAALPAPEREGRARPREYLHLRQDVYAAFTRISSEPYLYIRNSDEFTTEEAEAADSVQVPSVTLDDLLEHRRSFANSVEDEDKRDHLLKAVGFSSNPRANFHRTLIELGLLRHWYEFNYKLIRQKVTEWAGANNIEIPQEWFAPREGVQPVDSPQQTLSELARYLSDDEIRGLSIPFRAVEEMYRALPRRRES